MQKTAVKEDPEESVKFEPQDMEDKRILRREYEKYVAVKHLGVFREE
jgi:hypothetical protein